MTLQLKAWVRREVPAPESDRLARDLTALSQAVLDAELRFHLTRVLHVLCERPDKQQTDEP